MKLPTDVKKFSSSSRICISLLKRLTPYKQQDSQRPLRNMYRMVQTQPTIIYELSVFKPHTKQKGSVKLRSLEAYKEATRGLQIPHYYLGRYLTMGYCSGILLKSFTDAAESTAITADLDKMHCRRSKEVKNNYSGNLKGTMESKPADEICLRHCYRQISCLKRAVKADGRISGSLYPPSSSLDTAFSQSHPEAGAGKPNMLLEPSALNCFVSRQAQKWFHKSQPAH